LLSVHRTTRITTTESSSFRLTVPSWTMPWRRKTLLNGNIHAGSYVFIWDGKNDEGIQVEDGYYRVIYENNNYQCFANLLLE